MDHLFPEAHFSEKGRLRLLHMGAPSNAALVQGAMNMDAPFDITLKFAQRMMVWLLFYKLPSVPKRHVMQLGLGAASLTKFCHHTLRMRTTAVEINPHVVSACRNWFHLAPDDKLLKVIVADAGVEIRRPRWRQAIDVLQVDAYDQEAAAPILDSEAFYADCRQSLTYDGCMVANLFGSASNCDDSVQKIASVFGADCVWRLKPTEAGNTIVLAQRTLRRPTLQEMTERCGEIHRRWNLQTRPWMELLQPIQP